MDVYCGVWLYGEEGHHDWLENGDHVSVITPWHGDDLGLKPIDRPGLDGIADVLLSNGAPPHTVTEQPVYGWRVWHRSGVVSFRGEGRLARSRDWTLLAAWDRSGDERLGSYSAFLLEGTLSVEDAKRVALARFPEIWARINTLFTCNTSSRRSTRRDT